MRAPRRRMSLRSPHAVELAYYRELRGIVRAVFAHLMGQLRPLLGELTGRAAALHGDAAPMHPARRAAKVVDRARVVADRLLDRERLERAVARVGRSVSVHQRVAYERAAREALSVLPKAMDRSLRPLIARWETENVALIRSLPTRMLDRVESVIHRGFRDADRPADIADALQTELGVAESRAKLIARDQVAKLNGEVNRHRQETLGATHYTWRTVSDERCRPAHRARDGETFAWADPPGDESDPGDGGHPAEGINCRCWADPVWPGAEEA